MYICVKFPFENLNHVPYLLHSTSTYTYGVIITPRVNGGQILVLLAIL